MSKDWNWYGRKPVFARPVSEDRSQGDQPDGNSTVNDQQGMTLREHFAGLAMQGWLGSYGDDRSFPNEEQRKNIATGCCSMADDLLAALAKEIE